VVSNGGNPPLLCSAAVPVVVAGAAIREAFR
jgi:hypothetical protein